MSDPSEIVRCFLEGRASRLASRIARCVEETLVDRAVKLAVRESARNGTVTLVTTDHVRRVLERPLLEEAFARAAVEAHGQAEEGCVRSIAG